MTGSEFSEFQKLELNTNDLDSTQGFRVNERDLQEYTPLKVAKFKKIDWDKLETNLIGHRTRNNFNSTNRSSKKHSTTLENRPAQHYRGNPSPDLLLEQDNSHHFIEPAQNSQNRRVDWAHYLPRLRKSLRGVHPLKL